MKIKLKLPSFECDFWCSFYLGHKYYIEFLESGGFTVTHRDKGPLGKVHRFTESRRNLFRNKLKGTELEEYTIKMENEHD